MRKIRLFIAMSLDGYIADKNGNVDWLVGQDENGEMIDSYSAFINGIDTVVMGWNTYHQLVTELSPEEWIYSGMTSYVITHRPSTAQDDIIFTDTTPCELIAKLKNAPGKDIWICGGASIVKPLVQQNQIDEYYISVIPTLLGGGIKLFDEAPQEIPLRLKHTQAYNGIVELVYERR